MSTLAPGRTLPLNHTEERAYITDRLRYWGGQLVQHDRGHSNRTRQEVTAALDRYLDKLADLVPALRLCHLPADMTVWHCEWCGDDVSGSEPSACAGCQHCDSRRRD